MSTERKQLERENRKKEFIPKLCKLLLDHRCILIFESDQLQTNQLHEIRKQLNGKAHIQMGNNLLTREAVRQCVPMKKESEQLLEFIHGRTGFLFLKNEKDLECTIDCLHSITRYFSAKEGQIAPEKVIIPQGNTELDPTRTMYFQAANICTKIQRGQIHVINDSVILDAGEIVTETQATLLNWLEMKPFKFKPISIKAVLIDSTLYPFKQWDHIFNLQNTKKLFWKALSNIAAVESQIGDTGVASVTVKLHKAFWTIASLSVGLDDPIRQIAPFIPKKPPPRVYYHYDSDPDDPIFAFMMKCVRLLSIIILLFPFVYSTTLRYEDGTSSVITTPRLRPGPNNFNITSKVVFNRPFKTGHCEDEPNVNEDPYGKVVLVMGEIQGCERFFKKVLPLQKDGAVGIMFARDDFLGDSGLYYYWATCTHKDCDGIMIPLVEIDKDSAERLYHRLDKGENITVELTDDHNAYGEPVVSGAYYAFTVISCLYSFGIMCFSGYRLHEFISVKGVSVTLNSAVFSLEILASLMRIIWCIDPWALYFIYPTHFSQVTVTLHVVPFAASNMLLACYWQESIRSFHVMQKVPRLRKFKWPLIVFVIVLFCADLGSGFVRAYGTAKATTASLLVVSLFYLMVDVGAGSFFIATGILVLHKLQSGVTKLSGKIPKRRLMLFTLLIIICAIGSFILLILTGLLVMILIRKAWLFYTFTFCQFFILESISLAQLLIFQSPDEKLGPTSSGSNQAKTDVRMLRQMSNTSDVSGTDIPMTVNPHTNSDSITFEEPNT